MDQLKSALNAILDVLWQAASFVLRLMAEADVWLRGVMAQFGVPPAVQTVAIVLVALLLFVFSFKLLSGFLRLLLIVVLMLLVVQAIGPLTNGPRRSDRAITLLG